MPVFASVLRGINLAGHHRVAMSDLRALYEEQGLHNSQTYIQSGNVVFKSASKDVSRLTASLNHAIEKRFGFRADVVLRSREELEALVAANPLVLRGVVPTQNIVVFLSTGLDRGTANAICNAAVSPEEIHTDHHHLFCYYPNGQGRSKMGAAIEKHLSKQTIMGTARNWNTVLKLLEMTRTIDR